MNGRVCYDFPKINLEGTQLFAWIMPQFQRNKKSLSEFLIFPRRKSFPGNSRIPIQRDF